jgi:hypothetical protein
MVLRDLNSGRRTARLALTVMVFSAVSFVARAQTPQAFFERSTVTGSGNTINATNVPVVISPGVTVYINVTMQFNVDHNGNLTLSSGYPQVVAAPNLLSASFVTGTYVGPSSVSNGNAIVTVSGPGVTNGGATTWSLGATTGADKCTYPSSATWYVGPVANSPVAARLTKAGITSTAWSYGVANGPSFNDPCGNNTGFTNNLWTPGTLIGASQSGNAITIASFTNAGGYPGDQSAPVAQITYTLKP